MAKSEAEWEIESAADSLMRAEEVKNNPKLYQKAVGILKKRKQALIEVTEESLGAAIRRKRRGQK